MNVLLIQGVLKSCPCWINIMSIMRCPDATANFKNDSYKSMKHSNYCYYFKIISKIKIRIVLRPNLKHQKDFKFSWWPLWTDKKKSSRQLGNPTFWWMSLSARQRKIYLVDWLQISRKQSLNVNPSQQNKPFFFLTFWS